MKQRAYVSKTSLDQSPVWKHKRPLLSWLDMELTERCNDNCIHCFINLPANDLTAKERELSTKEIEGILQEAASLGCLTVRFTGGEPLLREDFEEIYLFARQLGLKVLLFTNATIANVLWRGLIRKLIKRSSKSGTLSKSKEWDYGPF